VTECNRTQIGTRRGFRKRCYERRPRLGEKSKRSSGGGKDIEVAEVENIKIAALGRRARIAFRGVVPGRKTRGQPDDVRIPHRREKGRITHDNLDGIRENAKGQEEENIMGRRNEVSA